MPPFAGCYSLLFHPAAPNVLSIPKREDPVRHDQPTPPLLLGFLFTYFLFHRAPCRVQPMECESESMYVYISKMGTKKEYERQFRDTGLLKPREIPSVLWSRTRLMLFYLARFWCTICKMVVGTKCVGDRVNP